MFKGKFKQVSFLHLGPKQRLLLSLTFHILFWILIALIGFVLWDSGYLRWLSVPILFEFSALIKAKGRFAKRLTAIDAHTKLSSDPRKSILYLRSFEDESIDRIDEDGRNYEMLLTSVLEEMGPTVAIGRPTDKLSPLGAARMYIIDRDWRPEFKELMVKSRLIVISVGLTKGLIWEITTALRQVEPERLVFSFHYLQSMRSDRRELDYEQFRDIVREFLEHPMPERIGKALFLYFEPDWSIKLIMPDERLTFLFGSSSPIVITEALRPIFDRSNVVLRQSVKYTIFITWCIIALMYLFLFLCIFFRGFT